MCRVTDGFTFGGASCWRRSNGLLEGRAVGATLAYAGTGNVGPNAATSATLGSATTIAYDTRGHVTGYDAATGDDTSGAKRLRRPRAFDRTGFIPDPARQVRIDSVSGVNPEY